MTTANNNPPKPWILRLLREGKHLGDPTPFSTPELAIQAGNAALKESRVEEFQITHEGCDGVLLSAFAEVSPKEYGEILRKDLLNKQKLS